MKWYIQTESEKGFCHSQVRMISIENSKLLTCKQPPKPLETGDGSLAYATKGQAKKIELLIKKIAYSPNQSYTDKLYGW